MAKSSSDAMGNCESQIRQKRGVGGGPLDGIGERLYVDISWKGVAEAKAAEDRQEVDPGAGPAGE